jgi:transcriptional regulator with GAF, ATPase, and Fis domain
MMNINEDDFFRQFTLKICGSLDIEVALKQCFEYLQQILPAEAIYLESFDPSTRTILTIANVNTNHFPETDTIEGIASKKLLSFLLSDSGKKSVTYLNNSEIDKGAKYSELQILLILDGQTLGSFCLLARGWDQFTEYHAHLLSLISEPASIVMSNALKCRENIKLKSMLADVENKNDQSFGESVGIDVVGKTHGLLTVMEMADMISKSNSPVLLMGETGVGKDVIANYIHFNSDRKDGPFIKVNCGAIHENLIESELFGHEKGAFSGAVERKPGRFERANNGTIFLDEIGELPLSAQVKLLRVVQQKEIERVGGVQVISVNVRIISATNQRLEEMVETGRFREDLWFRLNVFPILIPPLRQRTVDIPSFVYYIMEEKTKELKLHKKPSLARGALNRLIDYHWPGNVRELENIIERELILNQALTPGQPLAFQHVNLTTSGDSKITPSRKYKEVLRLNDVLTAHFRHVLKLTKGKISGPQGAANLLDIPPGTLRHKLGKLRISFGRKK